MIQNIKSVLIGVTREFGPDESSSALAYGLSLAQQADAHATVLAASVKLTLSAAGLSRAVAGLVRAENMRLQALVETIARNAEADATAAGVTCTTQTPHIPASELLSAFSLQARLHDITVLDSEVSALNLDRGLFETLLTQSGRPILVVPPGRQSFSCRRIILAWDGSAKAARAASDALPFMRTAEAVEVICVTGEKQLPDAVRGTDIAPHLARHGVNVTVNTIAAHKGDVAAALLSAAANSEADILVMGGYVHSRMREMLLGGVTQSMLRDSAVPLLISH
jgi:nucleotide-binding universal stress UspA family protein